MSKNTTHVSRFRSAPTFRKTLLPAPLRGTHLLEGLEDRRLFAAVLGTAEGFAALAGGSVTNTGTTLLYGDLGVSPGTSITGFPPGIVVAPGQVHATDAVAANAEADATTAYNTLAGLPPTQILTGQDLGGLTLVPGVYKFDSSAQLTGTLTLDAQNDPDAMFVFQIGSTLTTASASSVEIINKPSCFSNVLWQVGSSATIGTTTTFNGAIIALASVSLNNGATITVGNAIALTGSVTMQGNTISIGQCGSISGLKFDDINGNGIRESGDLGVSGVTIFLDTNGNDAFDSGEVSTQTNGDGGYLFDKVPTGTYSVREVVPTGWVRTTANPGTVISPPYGNAPGGDFGNFKLGQISGTKFVDANSSGARDAGEIGFAGVTIYIDSNSSGTLDADEQRTVTASDGTYVLPGLAAGSYAIREVIPSGYTQTTPNPASVSIGSGGTPGGIDFGDAPVPIPPVITGGIGGTKFRDTNGDGIMQTGDIGLAGVTMFLDIQQNGVLDSGEPIAVTNSSGAYLFSGVTPGTYLVREVVPSGWILTTATPSAVTLTGLAEGTVVAGGNFGNFQLGMLSGTKFLDACGDGPTSNDKPLAGITVKLFRDLNGNGMVDASDGAAVKSTVTTSNGQYKFSGLTFGKYVVSEVSPSGYIPIGPTVKAAAIASGSNVTGLNFYNFKLVNCIITNIKYSVTHNGVTTVYSNLDSRVRTGDTVSVSFTVPAGESDKVSLVSYQAPNGAFTNQNLAKQTLFDQATGTFGPGRHTLTVKISAKHFQVDFVCGCVIPTFGAPGSNIAYTPQKRLISAARGGPAAASTVISGFVFNDQNKNGTANAGESRLSNWTVFLDNNNNGRLDGGEANVKTDSNGAYLFNGLNAGLARLKLVTKAGYMLTTSPANVAVTIGLKATGRLFGVTQI